VEGTLRGFRRWQQSLNFHATPQPARGMTQNRSGLVNGCLLLANCSQQGAVRAAAPGSPPSHQGEAKGNRLLFNNKSLQKNLKSQHGCTSAAASSLGEAAPAVPALGICTLHKGSWGFHSFIWGSRNPHGHLSALPHGWGQPVGTSARLRPPLAPHFAGKGGPGKGC